MGDAGEYICTAENLAGRTTASTTIIVQNPPVITIQPQSGQIYKRVGDYIRLECNASGYPRPSVKWVPLDRPAEVYYSA